MTSPQTQAVGVGDGEATAPTVCPADQHDTLFAYKNRGCKCLGARRANKRDAARRQMEWNRGVRRSTDGTGTNRRLQALVALGWRYSDLAARLGVTNREVGHLTRRSVVFTRTATRVAALYNELADHPGPSALGATKAKARGWLVPLWWDEDTIDDPSYVPVTVEPDEQTAANRDARQQRRDEVARLTALGLSAAQIAQRLGLKHDRQVVRDRQWLREQQREAS